MSDEITEARKKRVKKIRRRRAGWFLFALALVAAAMLLANTLTATTFLDAGDFAKTLFAPFGSYPVTFESAGAVDGKQMSMAYAVLSQGDVTVYSSRGSVLGRWAHGYVSPQIAAAGNRAVLYSVGGREINVYNRTSALAQIKTDFTIVDAAVSGKGLLAVLTRSDKYTAELCVYENGNYKKTMTWYAGAGFPLLVRVQSGGNVAAVACVHAANGRIATTVTAIDTRAAAVLFTAEVDGLAAELIVDDGGGIIAVTDETAAAFSASGEPKASYAYGDAPLLYVAHDEGSGLALAFGDNNRPQINTVALLDRNLGVRAEAGGVGRVDDLYLSRSALYVLGNGTITEYTMSGKARAAYAAGDRAFAIIKTGSLLTLSTDKTEKAEHIDLQEEEQ